MTSSLKNIWFAKVCGSVQNLKYCTTSLNSLLFCNENTSAKSVQTSYCWHSSYSETELFLKRSVMVSYRLRSVLVLFSFTTQRSVSWFQFLPCANTVVGVVSSDSDQCLCSPVSPKETLKPLFNEKVCLCWI